MANEDKKKQEPEVVDAKAKHEGLVKMEMGDEVLHVHPTTVKDHVKAGWKVS